VTPPPADQLLSGGPNIAEHAATQLSLGEQSPSASTSTGQPV
jgi:hypothetical protein